MWQEKDDEIDFPSNNSSRIKTFVFFLTESERRDLSRQNQSLAKKIHGHIFNCFRMKPFCVFCILYFAKRSPGDGDPCLRCTVLLKGFAFASVFCEAMGNPSSKRCFVSAELGIKRSSFVPPPLRQEPDKSVSQTAKMLC